MRRFSHFFLGDYFTTAGDNVTVKQSFNDQVLLICFKGSVYIFFFRSCHTACWILVSQPGIEPVPLTVKVRRLNHWTTREFPGDHFLKKAIQSILRL